MNEYKGKSAYIFSQAESKLMILFPAFNKVIPKVKNSANFLDLGCGIGDFSEHVLPKGYSYFGIDNSKDMIARARSIHPELVFKVSDARYFSKDISLKFDIVLISMLFLTMAKKSDIQKTLSECSKVLKDNGRLIIGEAHPACDPYMQKHYFGRKDIEAKFEGYFKSGLPFVAHKKLSTGKFDFHDFHWTLKDYFDAIKNAGLILTDIDECEPDIRLRHIDPKYFDKYRFYPTYLVLVCKKSKSNLF